MNIQDSPVDVALHEGPRDTSDWPGYKHVWNRVQEGCQKMAEAPHVHLSQDHVDAMADLGSGHEERMKGRMHWMIDRGYLV